MLATLHGWGRLAQPNPCTVGHKPMYHADILPAPVHIIVSVLDVDTRANQPKFSISK